MRVPLRRLVLSILAVILICLIDAVHKGVVNNAEIEARPFHGVEHVEAPDPGKSDGNQHVRTNLKLNMLSDQMLTSNRTVHHNGNSFDVSTSTEIKPTMLNDIYISVKTTQKFHKARLDLILRTWYKLAQSQVSTH